MPNFRSKIIPEIYKANIQNIHSGNFQHRDTSVNPTAIYPSIEDVYVRVDSTEVHIQ